MKTIKSNFFEIVVNNEIVDEKGNTKRVAESYVTPANTFSEAEAAVYKFFGVGEEVCVKKMAIAPYAEIFQSEDSIEETRYYKVVIKIFTIDERTAKEKSSKVYHLVEATDIDIARRNVREAYKSVACEYEIVSLVESKILEII